jgi:Flp pilus assembly protein TadG
MHAVGRCDAAAMFRRFGRSRRATVALEFALVGPIFLLLSFMIIEDGVMLFAQAVLDNATRDASRQMMIGNVTTSAQFNSAICANVSTLIDCTALHFTVTSGNTFPSSVVIPSSSGVFASPSFSTGGGSSYVLVEVAYDRSYVTPWLVSIGGNDWVLLATVAFQNEPNS